MAMQVIELGRTGWCGVRMGLIGSKLGNMERKGILKSWLKLVQPFEGEDDESNDDDEEYRSTSWGMGPTHDPSACSVNSKSSGMGTDWPRKRIRTSEPS